MIVAFIKTTITIMLAYMALMALSVLEPPFEVSIDNLFHVLTLMALIHLNWE